MLTKNKEYKFYQIINELRNIYLQDGSKKLYQDNNWCVYSQLDNVELKSNCYIDEYPEIDDTSFEEKSPSFIEERELQLIFRDELLQDVIVSTLSRKENASNEELLESIHYYDDNDTFLEL
ncbi:DUF7716 domain-containing protein [Clostridium estertheticum]|uniref:DUF7716 domain-containing protein n=1 Tax=Clostridium estertheticum subsp. estertheticum TaxID=1552 RepID=A0A1J0GG17_9CLOT|nr:hypothetical protein [Clostridium estertheticum]APC40314.1 hypothetical protein A7L45_09675 [Clostridium estertheticum subsp. estertheticum]MBU3174296.1 hypothetical protein [Clostridium estertheticum]MBZ9617874.1 hypothetical protein [Clostridium estertheticum subsp. laramiense]WAG73537.1 hypothetical protein LL032_20835 [Clostridium estertheticum]